MKRVHCLVSGEVQGVFFRAHTKEWARQLGLKGWVRNTDEGKVEVVVEGSEEKLKELIEKIKQGPPASRVTGVETEWEKPSKKFTNFFVKFD